MEIMCVACRVALPAVIDNMGHKAGLQHSMHCPHSVTVLFITRQLNMRKQ